jgi:hypothetical protein
MRRGGITSASDRRVSSDEQPSRTHGGPDGRSAKPKRAKRRVLRRERLSSAIRFPQIVCGSIPLFDACVGVPARVPRGEARRNKASSRAAWGGSFDSAPGYARLVSGTLLLALLRSVLMWFLKRAVVGQCDSHLDPRSTVPIPRAATPTRGHPDEPEMESDLPQFDGRSSSG